MRLLQNCLRAMKPQGRILVAEQVLAPGRADLLAKLTDFVLMMILPGRERDQDEFEQLFADADLMLQRVLPTASAYSILEVPTPSRPCATQAATKRKGTKIML